ncbi:O-antigen ligase family protein [Flagellimonas okinawensis]|uniref:O-antigen ligase family protein n=1 Tax=Flagellimonas okinawensis TaxID=3031324 RepID=A0ABT5XR17_9FLAO|nr:O-antigen ligase family protein [[Muricauda] okinawensis]MDF0708336.1 O-antigen ligase family protein [[Muricauda] okinawensis]
MRYIVLYLFVMNISSAGLIYVGGAIGPVLSTLSFMLLLIYFFFVKKGSVNAWMIVLGVLYFAIAGVQYSGTTSYFLNVTIKYFIIILGGYEVVKRTSNKEFILVLLMGAFTIFLHAAVIGGGSAEYGRFSGFYINPNAAGFICISGYALAYSLENKKARLVAQIIFTLMGLLTLSRTFIALWVILNLISLKINIKNIRIFVYGFGLLSLLLIFSELLPVKNPRIEQLKALTSSNEEVSVSEINEDSRTDTWSKYFNDIGDNPFFGSGFTTFTKKSYLSEKVGIHNTFLLVWGEAGFLPFIIIVVFYIKMLISSFRLFSHAPNLLMQSIGLFFFLMASHVYFTHAFILFISMWIQFQIEKNKPLLQ